jgi:predicted small lipoprotein YifL
MRPAAALLVLALAACGVKAPPRPPGAPEKPAPHDAIRAAPAPTPTSAPAERP